MSKLLIITILIFFIANSSSALLDKTFEVDAIMLKDLVLQFRVTNKSKAEVVVLNPFFHRNAVNLILSYGDGVVLSESWIPEHPDYKEIKLAAGESKAFNIYLKKRFSDISSKIKEHCIYLYWGYQLGRSGLNQLEIFNGAMVINREFCSGKK